MHKPAARLRDEMFKQQVTQRYVSIKSGIPEVRLSAIIRGKAEPTYDEMTALALVLKKPKAYLFDAEAIESAKRRALTPRRKAG